MGALAPRKAGTWLTSWIQPSLPRQMPTPSEGQGSPNPSAGPGAKLVSFFQ